MPFLQIQKLEFLFAHSLVPYHLPGFPPYYHRIKSTFYFSKHNSSLSVIPED